MYASLRAILQLQLTFKQIECPRAAERIRVGIPSTVEQASHGPAASAGMGSGASTSLIVAATENFITFIDAVRLGWISKDTLHPLLGEVIQAVNKVTNEDFANRGKIIQWLITLNQMRTTEELSPEQVRELTFDMEQAYNGFKAAIG
jgi:ESCRT-I complex subunit VPS28